MENQQTRLRISFLESAHEDGTPLFFHRNFNNINGHSLDSELITFSNAYASLQELPLETITRTNQFAIS
ncbi:hypothetical protein BTS2_3187 [Bacillus sp. TS-2]|nr:hypothetical protein BTS2_3187 [Bacillus sp. TS-2]